MTTQAADRPPFQIPLAFKAVTRWAERKVPDDYTDGDPRHWPGGPQYRPSANEFYLCVLGQKWAEHDGIAQPGIQYYIDKLPDGYAMFETHQPGGPQTYKRLFGHPTGRFYDSAVRFAPHFLWLMSGMDGECTCIYCAKKSAQPVTHRQSAIPRAPRETIDQSILGVRRHPKDGKHIDDDDDDDKDSSRASSANDGYVGRRAQRQVRQVGAPSAVDEEGTEDVYKDCVKRLENARGGTRGVEIDITEDNSIDWKAEREILPQYLTRIEQQHAFIPRIGELVLWCPSFLDEHYLMLDPATSEYKFYSFDQKCFHGSPAWRGGIVVTAPSASIKNGPVDFPDILDVPLKKTSFNTAGFRIETMPDPNDDSDKSMSKQYSSVPLRNIRPLTHWQMLLAGIPQSKFHPSIEYALTCMTSLSLLEKWRFNGSWPNARVFCKGIYIGAELIIVGDAIRLQPSTKAGEIQPDVLIVESIRYNLLAMEPEHAQSDNPHICSKSYISLVGSAYTTNLKKLTMYQSTMEHGHKTILPIKTSEVKAMFRTVGVEEYGIWYSWHGPKQRYEVSHEQVLGRLFEADAVRLWTGQRQSPALKKSSKLDLYFDMGSILAGRRYATQIDARLPEPQSKADINWHVVDTRAEGLAVATVNGVNVGKYHEVRTPATLKQWRMQLKIADGQQLASEVEDEYIKDLSQIQLYTGARRGRKVGSKLIDGKIVLPGQCLAHDGSRDIGDIKTKPSSQMAGAALASDSDSSEDSHSADDDDYSTDGHIHDLQTTYAKQATDRPKTNLSKADIMGSIEVPEDDTFDDDLSEGETWWNQPLPPARGGTEESSGGDYRD